MLNFGFQEQVLLLCAADFPRCFDRMIKELLGLVLYDHISFDNHTDVLKVFSSHSSLTWGEVGRKGFEKVSETAAEGVQNNTCCIC